MNYVPRPIQNQLAIYAYPAMSDKFRTEYSLPEFAAFIYEKLQSDGLLTSKDQTTALGEQYGFENRLGSGRNFLTFSTYETVCVSAKGLSEVSAQLIKLDANFDNELYQRRCNTISKDAVDSIYVDMEYEYFVKLLQFDGSPDDNARAYEESHLAQYREIGICPPELFEKNAFTIDLWN